MPVVKTKSNDRASGKNGLYEITPEQILDAFNGNANEVPGTYMVVVSAKGYLDYVEDNIVLTLTGAEAQYQFITTLISAGDVNGDGIIDDNDYRMFDELSKLFEGLYQSLAMGDILGQIEIGRAHV